MYVSAIIVAAGQGRRIGGTLPKQFQLIRNKPVLYYTLEKFEKSELIDEVVLVVADDWLHYASRDIVDGFGFEKIRRIVSGGKERQDSVRHGLQAVDDSTDYVVIHDAARPFVSVAKINQAIETCAEFGAVVLALPPGDTIKVATNGMVEKTLDRNALWAVQTPQVFKLDIIQKAHTRAREQNIYATDDAALVEEFGYAVKIVEGEATNVKITTPFDLQVAELFLQIEEAQST